MRKARNSKLALLLVLTMLATLFVAIPTASAATTYSALTAPTVGKSDSATDLKDLGTVKIYFDTLGSGTHKALFSLPKDFKINESTLQTKLQYNFGGTFTIVNIGGTNDNEWELDVVTTDVYDEASILMPLIGVYVPSTASSGDIKLTVDGLAGQLSSGEVVVGKVSGGQVTAYVKDVPSITEAGTTGGAIEINLKENRAGALEVADDSVKLTLPPGFSWKDITATDVSAITGNAAATLSVDSTNDRILYVDVTAASSSKTLLRLTVDIAVDESRASYGDVEVKIGGETDVTPTSLVIAKYADYGVKVSAESTPEILGGRLAQEIGNIVIEETAPNSLVDGRTVTLTLPDNAKWAEVGDVDNEGGLSIDGDIVAVGDDGKTIKFMVNQDNDNDAGTLTLKDITVDVALVDKAMDLKVTVGGSAGATGEVVVAKIVPPVSMSAKNKTDVKIGLRNQAAGDLTITETKAEAFIQGERVTLTLPDNVDWTSEPTVKVTSGNLEIDNVDVDDEVLSFRVTDESTVASTITITGIEYTVDRTVPEGDVTVKVGGPALDEVNDVEDEDWPEAAERDYYNVADFDEDGLFPDNTTAAKAVNANCVTPAPGETKGSAVFTLGQASYILNGQTVTMPVAPYAKNGRTYLPLRFCGNAIGIDDANIWWDGATKTATLKKDNTIVQVKLGSQALYVNGVQVSTMDVAPEAKDGYTMLPIRPVLEAFGAKVTYDAATQAISIEY